MRRRSLMGALAYAPGRPKVAAVVTEYRWYSHADVICGRLTGGNSRNGHWQAPRTELVSLYAAQKPAGRDMSGEMASRHGFKVYPTIREALTLGGSKLAVDAVVFIGEHGEYPFNDIGQHLYPRFELFNEVLDVYEQSGRAAPTFFDKHLSWSWEKAKKMYDRAARLKVPWHAGSSIPQTVRVPDLEIPLGAEVEHAVMVGYGPLDAYGFHTLETLGTMVERRKGGETGIRRVEMLEGAAVWSWKNGAGAWSQPLLETALSRCPERKTGRLEDLAKEPVAFVLEYVDGLKAVCYMLNGVVESWSFAGRRRGARTLDSCYFGLPNKGRTLPHFDGLVWSMEELFLTGRTLYPVERTLLAGGALSFLFESKRAKRGVETPELAAVKYQAPRIRIYQSA